MQFLENSQRIAGALLLSSIGPFAMIAVLAVRRQLPSIYGLFRPIQDLASELPLNGWDLSAQLAFVILILAGFGTLTVVLQEAGDRVLALVAFALFLAAMVLMAVEGAFYRSVNPWAAREAVRSGTTPDLFLALHHWMNTSVQMAYMVFGLLAFAGFGWSFLRTGLVPPLGAWATIIWSLAWLAYTVVAQTTLPAALFVWPWVIGVLLFLSP